MVHYWTRVLHSAHHREPAAQVRAWLCLLCLVTQPPFDEGMGNACLCHYTWGALYHEGLPSKGAKQVRPLYCCCTVTCRPAWVYCCAAVLPVPWQGNKICVLLCSVLRVPYGQQFGRRLRIKYFVYRLTTVLPGVPL